MKIKQANTQKPNLEPTNDKDNSKHLNVSILNEALKRKANREGFRKTLSLKIKK